VAVRRINRGQPRRLFGLALGLGGVAIMGLVQKS